MGFTRKHTKSRSGMGTIGLGQNDEVFTQYGLDFHAAL